MAELENTEVEKASEEVKVEGKKEAKVEEAKVEEKEKAVVEEAPEAVVEEAPEAVVEEAAEAVVEEAKVEEPEELFEEAEEETETSDEETEIKSTKIDVGGVGVIDSSDLLVALDDEKHGYLTHGVHIGLKYRTSDMRPFIYRIRPDKLCVFEVSKIDKRIKTAAKFISRFNPKDVFVVSNRDYGKHPIKKFAECVGCIAVTKRFVSGTLTNPNIETYVEPKLIIITDPSADLQAIKEASETGITTIAICDTNTRFKNLDFVIPGNNKGKNSLALIYWLLAREISRINGKEFNVLFESFVSHAEQQQYLLKMQELQRLSKRRQRGKPRR